MDVDGWPVVGNRGLAKSPGAVSGVICYEADCVTERDRRYRY